MADTTNRTDSTNLNEYLMNLLEMAKEDITACPNLVFRLAHVIATSMLPSTEVRAVALETFARLSINYNGALAYLFAAKMLHNVTVRHYHSRAERHSEEEHIRQEANVRVAANARLSQELEDWLSNIQDTTVQPAAGPWGGKLCVELYLRDSMFVMEPCISNEENKAKLMREIESVRKLGDSVLSV